MRGKRRLGYEVRVYGLIFWAAVVFVGVGLILCGCSVSRCSRPEDHCVGCGRPEMPVKGNGRLLWSEVDSKSITNDLYWYRGRSRAVGCPPQ